MNLLFVGEVSVALLGEDSEVLVDAAVEGLQHEHAQVRMLVVAAVDSRNGFSWYKLEFVCTGLTALDFGLCGGLRFAWRQYRLF